MQRLIPMIDNSGVRYSIPEDRVDEFRADMGENASEGRRYRGKDGAHYTIPQDQDEAFRADMPDAVPVRTMQMSDGTKRDFTDAEMSRYLRSPEYRESEDYIKPEQKSVAYEGFKGALSGAAQGAYAGGKSSLGKVVAAIPEMVAGATEAVGNAINLGGNAPNAVGNWFRDSGRGVKKWLDDNVKSSVSDNLGYEDWSTKMSEIAGDAAGMAVKFAPAAAMGPAFMESVFATDGLNAYASSFEAAKANGASDFDANLAGAASGLISYYGGKLLMKGNAATSEIKSILGRALGGIGWDAAVMAAQQAGEKGVKNVIEGKPITQDMLGAGLEGAATGAQFRIFNEGSHVRDTVRETKRMREMRRENLLTAAENTNGGAFLDSLMGGEEMNSAVRARRNGEDVSRKMGKALDLPDNMSVKERNAVVDAVVRARDAQAERVRTKMDDVQAQSLADAIGGTVGDMNDPNFEKVWIKAVAQVKDATELDDPAKRAEVVANAVKEVFGAEAEGNDGVKREGVFDEASIRAKNEQNLKKRNESAMERDAAEHRAGMEAAEREETQAKIDAKINAKIADQKAQKEEFTAEMREKAQAEYDERMAAYEEARAKRAAEMKKTGKAVTELPEKPDHDALLAEQKSRMDAADKAAAEAAHEERGKGLAEAFADWREESVKARKQGKKSPEPTAEVEDVRAKAEADAVVQRLNAEWQKAKTPAERNAIKAQLIDRLKEIGIGATERGTSAAEKVAESAKVPDGRERMVEKKTNGIGEDIQAGDEEIRKNTELFDNLKSGEVIRNRSEIKWGTTRKVGPSRAPTKQGTTSQANGAEGVEARSGASDDVRAANVAKAAKIIAETVAKHQNREVTDKDISGQTDGARRLIEAIENKDADALRSRFNGLNAGSVKAFEAITGIKMPKTQKGRHEIVDRFCGITPEQRAKIETERAEASKKAAAEREHQWKVDEGKRIIGETKIDWNTAQKLGLENRTLDELIEKGWTLEKARRGAANEGRVVNHETGVYFKVPKGAYTYLEDIANKLSAAKKEDAVRVPDGKGKMVEKSAPAPEAEVGELVHGTRIGFNRQRGKRESVDVSGTLRLISGDKAYIELANGKTTIVPKDSLKSDGEYKSAKESDAKWSASMERAIREGRIDIKDIDDWLKKTPEEIDSAKAEAKSVAPTSAPTSDDMYSLKRKMDAERKKFIAKNSVDAHKTTEAQGYGEVQSMMGFGNHLESYDITDAKSVENGINETERIATKSYGNAAEFAKDRLNGMKRALKDAGYEVYGEEGARKIRKITTHNDTVSAPAPKATAPVVEKAKGGETKPKMTNAEAETEFRKFINGEEGARAEEVVAQLGPKKAQRILASATKYFKMSDAAKSRSDKLQAYISTMGGKETPLGNELGGGSARQKYDAALKKRFDAEREAAMKPLTDAIRAKADAVLANMKDSEAKDGIKKEIDELLAKDSLKKGEIDRLKLLLYRAPSSGDKIEIPLGKTGSLKVADNIDALLTARDNLRGLGRDAARKYYEVAEADRQQDDISMRANDAKRRSRPEVLAWAKKNMRQIIDGKVTVEGMREYDAQMAKKAKSAVKRLFPDMEIEYYEKDPNLGGKAVTLRNRSGGVLGYFSPSDKRVALLPGADAETVAHEVGWHGVRDWAKRNAPDLFKKMREVEDNVDPALRTKVLRIYRTATGYDRDTLLNEFGAWTFMGRGGKALEEVVSTREGAAWYAKMLNAAKDIYKDFATKHGGNRIYLSRINEMNGEEFMDYMAKEIAGGKSLGNIKELTQGGGSGKEVSVKEERFEKLKRKTYDVGTVFRALEKDIEKKTGTKVASDDSVDQAFALKAGLNEATNINLKAKIHDLKKLYADNGISHDDFVGYMAAKAAAGRDAKIDAENIKALQEQMHDQLRAEWGRARIESDPEGFKAACESMDAIIERNYRTSNGSHIDPREAARTVREWESGDMAEKTAKLRKAWREIIDETIDAQVEAGLVSRETAERWKAEEPEYVPFKSPIDEATGEYVGRADRNFSRAEHFEAKGRQTAAGDVLTHALMDWQTTMNRAADNNVRTKLAKLVEKHPELGTVEKLGNSDVREKKTKDKFTKDGRLILDDGGDPNVIIFKRDGQSYVIRMNGTRGTAAAAAITGRNLKHVNSKIKRATRFSAGMATEYSPTFAARNWQKDQLALGEIVVAERGAVEGGKWIGHYAVAQKDTHAALWKFVTTGKVDANTKGGRILQDFIDAGGMIGGYEKESFGDVAKELSLGEITKELKQGKNLGVAVAKHTLKSVAYLNKMSELTSRVNAFEAERRMGKDKDGRAVTNESAALFARRVLVDFNRAGENTGWTNTWKMFSNSAIGANARAVEAACSNKHGAALLTTMAVWGAAQAIINHIINADADVEREKLGLGTGKDVGEWEIRSSFANFRIGDKTYKIGQHEDVFTFASYVGNTMARCVMGEISREDAAKNLGIAAAELGAVFTGLGDANLDSKDGDAAGVAKAIIVYLTPSIVQPVAELALNQDYAGRKVFTDTYPGNHTPRSRQGRKGTPEYAKTTAEALNDATGGNEHRRGFADVPPEAIRKLVEGFGKNALKDVMNIYETGKAIMNGEYDKLTPDLKPVKRDFVRQVPDSTNRFFDRKTSVETDIDDWKGNRASMTPDERKAYVEAHPWVKQSVQDRLNTLVNGSKKYGIRGINDLRKLIDGKVLRGDEWVKREEPPSDERIEAWTAELRKKQAKYLELTQKK